MPVGSVSKSNTISGSLFWKLCERFGLQVIQMVVSIVIARILEPTEYGSVAMLSIFISLATVFVESGLSSALIQKPDTDDADRSAVFFYSMVMALLLYVLLFACSPLIADFYGMPQLENLLRGLALVLFPGAFNSLQISILSKRMEFKTQAKASLAAVTISGSVGIALALMGFGAWALICYQLGARILTCLLLYSQLKWLPSLSFSLRKTVGLLRFGVKLLGANLVDTLYLNVESLIIGKKFSAATLAFCDKGKMFPLVLINNVDGSIQSVMFPSYALKQGDMPGLRKMLLKTISVSTYLTFPVMIGLACAAEPLVWLILGDKWMGAVPFLMIYCAICALFPFQTAGLQALNAIGRSGDYFRVIVIKRLAGLVLLAIAAVLFDTPYAILVAAFLGEIVGTVLSAIPLQATIGVTLAEQFKVCAPNFCMALLMGCGVYALTFIGLPYPLLLLLQILAGVAIYSLESIAIKSENFKMLKEMCFKLLRKGHAA